MTDTQLMFEYMVEYSKLYRQIYDKDFTEKIRKIHESFEVSGKTQYENSFYNLQLYTAQSAAQEKHPKLYKRMVEIGNKIQKLKNQGV